MTGRKSIFDWAKEYTGDPVSWDGRGKLIRTFLKELGLKPEHKVLNVGCGCLSEGAPLINYLDAGNYVGLDPNGWLVESALLEMPELEERKPRFYYGSDFQVPERDFDFVVSHSVLSHVADWQLDLALANVRPLVKQGGVWLASYRRGSDDSYSRVWQYPGISEFRFETVTGRAFTHGWDVVEIPEYKERMVRRCRNDFHDWLKLTAITTPAEVNLMRLTVEGREKRDREILQMAERLWREEQEAKARELEEALAEPEPEDEE